MYDIKKKYRGKPSKGIGKNHSRFRDNHPSRKRNQCIFASVKDNKMSNNLKVTIMKTIKMIMMAVMMTIVTSASAMTYTQAKDQAMYLADKMAYELGLTDEQFEAAYMINLDYLMEIDRYDDVYGIYWTRRNRNLRSVLTDWQYDRYIDAEYFYRPVYWSDNTWRWRIYSHYDRDYYYHSRPRVYITYRGGNPRNYYVDRSWRRPTVPVRRVESRNYNRYDNRNYNYNRNDNRNYNNNVNRNNDRSFGNMQSAPSRANTRSMSSNSNYSFGSGSSSMSKSNTPSRGNSSFGGHR